MRRLCLVLSVLCPLQAHAGGTLRFGIDFDYNTLDPARSGSYIERVVNTARCDQLLDIDAALRVVPQLATAWAWSDDHLALTLTLRDGVQYQDGAPFDAESVRANLDRYRTAPYSFLRNELKPITAIEVPDSRTVVLRLSQPYAPLPTLLASRSGTMLSPRILGGTVDQIAQNPVCAGPFSLVERVAQDHVTLARFPGYWDAARVTLDRVEFRVMTDSTVRLVNLQSGQLDIVNRLAATDVAAVTRDRRLRVARSPALGFQLLSFNVAHGPAADTPFGRDVRVRRAFAMAIDRDAINQAVFEGLFVPNNQLEPPGGAYWNPAHPLPKRDVAGARALLAQAGVPNPKLTLSLINAPTDIQVGEVIQSLAAEAGFEVTLRKGESVSMTEAAARGEYQAYMVIWSGRPDPDGNTSIWMRCGSQLNWGSYCNKELDAALDAGSAGTDDAARRAAYARVSDLWMADLPYLPLYHFTWLWGLTDRVQGFAPRPDGLARLVGVSIN